MTHRVIVTDQAQANLCHYYERAAEVAPHTAEAWLKRFQAAILTLAELPERCSTAPENNEMDSPVFIGFNIRASSNRNH